MELYDCAAAAATSSISRRRLSPLKPSEKKRTVLRPSIGSHRAKNVDEHREHAPRFAVRARRDRVGAFLHRVPELLLTVLTAQHAGGIDLRGGLPDAVAHAAQRLVVAAHDLKRFLQRHRTEHAVLLGVRDAANRGQHRREVTAIGRKARLQAGTRKRVDRRPVAAPQMRLEKPLRRLPRALLVPRENVELIEDEDVQAAARRPLIRRHLARDRAARDLLVGLGRLFDVLKEDDRPCPSGLGHFNFVLLQVPNGTTVRVSDLDVEPHEFDAGFERRRLWRCSLRRSGRSSEREEQCGRGCSVHEGAMKFYHPEITAGSAVSETARGCPSRKTPAAPSRRTARYTVAPRPFGHRGGA